MNLSVRSDTPELMDDPSTSAAEHARCLADLAQVNIVTRTHAPTLAWLAKATKGMAGPVRILDIACGHGDLLRAIARWAEKRGLPVVLEGIDLNPGSAMAAAAATPPGMAITWRTGDVFDHQPDPAPDFIVSSQFAHHLDDAQVVAFIAWLDAHARRGWLIVDIHRHILAYHGFRLLSWAMRWHWIVRHDGAVSVTRGFRRAEWQASLEAAGVTATIRWLLLFRHAVGRLR